MCNKAVGLIIKKILEGNLSDSFKIGTKFLVPELGKLLKEEVQILSNQQKLKKLEQTLKIMMLEEEIKKRDTPEK